jgi:hypothetical protein
MGGNPLRTAHKRTKPPDSSTPAAATLPWDLPTQRCRLCPALPRISGHEPPQETPRLRWRPQAPGHGRDKKKTRFRAEANRPFLLRGRSRTGGVDFIRWEDLREALRGRRSIEEPPTSGGRTCLSNTPTADRKDCSCQSSPKAIRWCPALQGVFRARRASLRSCAGVNRRVRSGIDVRPGGHHPPFP